eukprot:GEMP01003664.1.p1 GENE.GEMP01003664.1~~GEMP01003664.1.p1  ORF type:complete len:1074 (+),score=233.13 GEMP01003664.1:159-3380(+)
MSDASPKSFVPRTISKTDLESRRHEKVEFLEAKEWLEDVLEDWGSNDMGWTKYLLVATCHRKAHQKHGLRQKLREANFLPHRLARSEERFTIFLISSRPIDSTEERRVGISGNRRDCLWDCLRSRNAIALNKIYFYPKKSVPSVESHHIDLSKLTQTPSIKQQERTITFDLGADVVSATLDDPDTARVWHRALRECLLCIEAMHQGRLFTFEEELLRFDKLGIAKCTAQAENARLEILSVILNCGRENGKIFAYLGESRSVLLSGILGGFDELARHPLPVLEAAVRVQEPWMNVLEFWERSYHLPLVRCIEALWTGRSCDMSAEDFARLADFLAAYRNRLQSLGINCAFDDAIDMVALHCGRRIMNTIQDLAEAIAEKADIQAEPGGVLHTTGPIDVFTVLEEPLALSDCCLEVQIEVYMCCDSFFREFLRKCRQIVIGLQKNLDARYCETLFGFLNDCSQFMDKFEQVAKVGEGRTEEEVDILSMGGCKRRCTDMSVYYRQFLVTHGVHVTNLPGAFGFTSRSNGHPFHSIDFDPILPIYAEGYLGMIRPYLDQRQMDLFAAAYLTRFLALDIKTLLKKTTLSRNLTQTVRVLDRHLQQCIQCFQKWISKKNLLEDCVRPLGDIREFLDADPVMVPLMLSNFIVRYSEFGADTTKFLLDLRSDVSAPFATEILDALRSLLAMNSSGARNRTQHWATVPLDMSQGYKTFEWVQSDTWLRPAAKEKTLRKRDMVAGVGKFLARMGPQNNLDDSSGSDAESASQMPKKRGKMHKFGNFFRKQALAPPEEAHMEDEHDDPEMSLASFLGGEHHTEGSRLTKAELESRLFSLMKNSGRPSNFSQYLTVEPVPADARTRRGSGSSLQRLTSFRVSWASIEDEDKQEAILDGWLYKKGMVSAMKRNFTKGGNRLFDGNFRAFYKSLSGKNMTTSAKMGWNKRYFAVKRDRRNRACLYWYDRPEHTVCQGSLPLSDVTGIECLNYTDASTGKKSYAMRILCPQRTKGLKLRCNFVEERDHWIAKFRELIAEKYQNGEDTDAQASDDNKDRYAGARGPLGKQVYTVSIVPSLPDTVEEEGE